MSSITECEKNISLKERRRRRSSDIARNQSRLLVKRPIRKTNFYWIGFASSHADITLTTPDLDENLIDSWIDWLQDTHLLTDYNDNNNSYIDNNNGSNVILTIIMVQINIFKMIINKF